MKIMTLPEIIKPSLIAGRNITWDDNNFFFSARSLNSLILQHYQQNSFPLCVYFLGKGDGEEKSCSGFCLWCSIQNRTRQMIRLRAESIWRQNRGSIILPLSLVWCVLHPCHCWPTSADLPPWDTGWSLRRLSKPNARNKLEVQGCVLRLLNLQTQREPMS